MALNQLPLLTRHESSSSCKEYMDYEPVEKPSRSGRSTHLGVSFLVSMIANAMLCTLLLWQNFGNRTAAEEPLSVFAGLRRNVPKQWNGNHAGTSQEWDEIWGNLSSYDAGVIALHDDYARDMGLPRSQRWPWDASKGIYILNGYHNLHCIRNLHDSLEEFKAGKEQTIPWAHVQHCLLTLRDEIFCNADDTPRYTGFQPEATSAYGQIRMCRDWSQLEAWALHRTRAGCWRDIPGEEGVEGFQVLDRYRFCGPDNEYREMAQSMWKENRVE